MEVRSSLVEDMSVCVVCKRPREQIHHVLRAYNRHHSEEYAYLLPLCAEHHTGNTGIHNDKQMDIYWRRKAQEDFEEKHGTRQGFINIFGKSYL